MTKITQFEDLECWVNARQMAVELYKTSTRSEFRKDYDLKRQIRRAAGSVMHNIAEGFDAGSDAEFIRFLKISRRSASEIQSHLYLAQDLGYVTATDRYRLHNEYTSIKKLINVLIRYLNSSLTK